MDFAINCDDAKKPTAHTCVMVEVIGALAWDTTRTSTGALAAPAAFTGLGVTACGVTVCRLTHRESISSVAGLTT